MSNLANESNVLTLGIGAEEYDAQIRSYQPTSGLDYKFKNPKTVAVGQRPNPDADPARVDVSGELWQWKLNAGNIVWNTIVVISPLKEAMKAFVCDHIENNAWGTAYSKFKSFKSMQDILKDPSAWPWSQEHVIHLLAAVRIRQDFTAFRGFYRWAADMQIPGFTHEIAHRIKDIPWQDSPSWDEARRTRKNVLSLDEERLLRKALEPFAPLEHDPLPESYSPDATIHIKKVAGLLGYRGAYGDYNQSNTFVKLSRLGVEPFETIKQRIGQLGYLDRYYRMGDVIPAARRYLLQVKLDYLHSNISTHLAFALGPRPAQILGMDEGGFKKQVEDGVTYYSIDVPRRKKKQEGKASAKRRKFPAEIGLGQKIEEYIRLKRDAESEGIFEQPAAGPIPLFYAFDRGFWKVNDPPVKAKRPNEGSMAFRISNFLHAAGVERSAKDLRSNVAQRLADAGYSAELIKEVLDHQRTDHIKAYVKAALGLSEILQKALATNEDYQSHVAKLRGITVIPIKDITKETDVISGTINHKLISGIGACDRQATGGPPCEQEIVYSCYGCSDFHPFDDVLTHEQVLTALQAEVIERLQESDGQEPTKLAFAHQETILTVKAIIQLIEEEAEHG